MQQRFTVKLNWIAKVMIASQVLIALYVPPLLAVFGLSDSGMKFIIPPILGGALLISGVLLYYHYRNIYLVRDGELIVKHWPRQTRVQWNEIDKVSKGKREDLGRGARGSSGPPVSLLDVRNLIVLRYRDELLSLVVSPADFRGFIDAIRPRLSHSEWDSELSLIA